MDCPISELIIIQDCIYTLLFKYNSCPLYIHVTTICTIVLKRGMDQWMLVATLAQLLKDQL